MGIVNGYCKSCAILLFGDIEVMLRLLREIYARQTKKEASFKYCSNGGSEMEDH